MLGSWKPVWSPCRQHSSYHLYRLSHLKVRISTTIFRIKIIIFVTDRSLHDDSLHNILFTYHRIYGLPPSRDVAVVDFMITYVISIISAALGLAKCLKNGVARPIAPGGRLDGYLTWKFLLAFMASVVILVSRGLYFGLIYFFILSKLDDEQVHYNHLFTY